jgi:hypothetical protein
VPTTENGCPVSSGVPECGTGPLGRVRFVGSELRDVWRELRERVHRAPRSRTAPDVGQPGTGNHRSS